MQAMNEEDPVSVWLDELKQGDQSAARHLWQHFVLRLQSLARQKLHPDSRRVYDEEDAAASVFLNLKAEEDAVAESFMSREPTPEFSAEFIEICEQLFAALEEPSLQEIGRLKIEGYRDNEIADQLECSRRTIQRKVERIRRIWSRVVPE
ncbi:MAG: ECF-type sigma factor [Planctomycetota bacterium]